MLRKWQRYKFERRRKKWIEKQRRISAEQEVQIRNLRARIREYLLK